MNLLTSFEKRLLTEFILLAPDRQREALLEAEMNVLYSGPLLNAMRTVLEVI